MIDLTTFMAMYLGIAHTGDTPANKGQCVGLVEQWLDAQKRPHIWGDAKDLLANAGSGYRVTRNGPTNAPAPGNVVCWDSTWGAGAGHTAVVVAANSNYLVVFEQNNPQGSPPIVTTHGYSGVLGWLAW